MTGKARSLHINAGHGVSPESLLLCAGGKEIDAKDAETLFEMKEYDFFVMCWLTNLLLGKYTSNMARGRHPKHGLKKQKTNPDWLILKPLIFGLTAPYSKWPYLRTILCAGWYFAAEIKYCDDGRRRLYEPFSSEWRENGRQGLVNKNWEFQKECCIMPSGRHGLLLRRHSFLLGHTIVNLIREMTKQRGRYALNLDQNIQKGINRVKS